MPPLYVGAIKYYASRPGYYLFVEQGQAAVFLSMLERALVSIIFHLRSYEDLSESKLVGMGLCRENNQDVGRNILDLG